MAEEKQRYRVVAPSRTVDSYQNFAARIGIGTDNLASGGSYGFNPVSRNRIQLEWMYRGSWLVGQAVDCVAEDMTRAGIDIASDIAPDVIEEVSAGLERRMIWQAISDEIKWSRLYGGAIGVLLVDGQKPNSPLRMETVGRGAFKGILVLDRWMVQPTLSDVVTDYGPELGLPRFYDVTADAPAFRGERVHHSRVIRMDGVTLPYWQRIAENGWGLSIIERLYDRLVAFDSTTQGAAQLVFKAYLRQIGVKNLRAILAEGGKGEAALAKMFEMIRALQTNEGLTIIDAEDTFATHAYSFSGLSDVLLQFAQQLSGATQIPLVRLFGQSPAGLNATGESDIRSYYDLIAQKQEVMLRAPMTRVLELTYRSDIGPNVPDDLSFDFNPLWQMSDVERAQIAVGVTGAVTQAADSGLVSKTTALRELRQSSDVTGVWSNVTDEEIAAAESDPPPPVNEGLMPDVSALLAATPPDVDGRPGDEPEVPVDPRKEG